MGAKDKDTTFLAYSIRCGKKIVRFERPALMGILNVSADSFHDGGCYFDEATIVARAHQIVDEGGDIIDVGAVSTRPGSKLPESTVEADQLFRTIQLIRSELPEAIISADTSRSLPSQKAVEAGADILNDISGGQFDDTLWDTVAELQVPYIFSHTRGLPSEMQHNTHYDDLMGELIKYFSAGLEQLYLKGINDVILDPGFGFAKTLEQNHFLMHHLDEITSLFREPVLVGISRKSMICKRLNITHQEALNGTTVLNTIALMKGARMLRVHDVREAHEAIDLTLDI